MAKGREHVVEGHDIVSSMYRPFTKQWAYANKSWNWTRHLMPRYFPNISADNKVIIVSGVGSRSGFSAFISGILPDLEVIEKGQCFPLFIYDSTAMNTNSNEPSMLFDHDDNAQKRRSAITDYGLNHFRSVYNGEDIEREDIFYYVYGILHSTDFRVRYADNLSKELPRIPCVKTAVDFWKFSRAGRTLAGMHLDYESIDMFPAQVIGGRQESDFRVDKMKYRKAGKEKDRTTVIYNDIVTITGIPLEAYEYIINGKPALDWVVDRQCVTTDKDSGITDNANDWAIETMNNPRYPLELFLRVITVSLETMKIVKALPPLDIG